MNKKILSSAIVLALSTPVFVPAAQAGSTENTNPHYVHAMNEMADKLIQRIKELKKYAENPDFYTVENGRKFIDVNGIQYEIDETFGTPLIPLRHYADDSAIRNLFNLYDQNWELSQYMGGATFVHKTWGNYDYGNGCILEYTPKSDPDAGFMLKETMSCKDGSNTNTTTKDATSIAPFKFGINADYANLVSIESIDDKMFVAHSPLEKDHAVSVPMLGIYDVKTNTTTQILGIDASQPYQGIDDLRTYGSQLFVSAINEHGRIDIFDGETEKYQYSYAVDHNGISKIAVNEDFIFVADEKKVTVYHRMAVTQGDVLSLQPFATLSYAHGQPTSVEFVGSMLLAASKQGSAVYDLTQLSQHATLAPVRDDLGGVDAIDANDKYIFVKESNSEYIASTTRWAIYETAQFIANGYQFNDAAKAVYLIDNFWVKGNDLLVRDNDLISLTDSIIEVVKFDKLNTLDFTPNTRVVTTQLTFNALPTTASVRKVLQEGLNEGVNSLSANLASMVNVRFLDRDYVEITNFTDVDLQGVDLDIRAHSQHSWVRLATLDSLPAYTRIKLPVSALNSDKRFNAVDHHGVYDFSGMLSTLEGKGHTYGHYGTQNLIDSRFTTTTNHPLLEKLSKIKATWDVEFSDVLLGVDNSESPWDARSTKRHLEVITNVAYVVSSDSFKDKLMNYKANYGHDMYLFGETFKTEEQYAALLKKTLESNAFFNYRPDAGFERAFQFGKNAGTVFGLSDAELDKIERGDVHDFALYLGEQIGNNWHDGCIPVPCAWEEIHFAKLFVEVYEELANAGELPY